MSMILLLNAAGVVAWVFLLSYGPYWLMRKR